MPNSRSVETRLLQVLAGIAVVAVLGVLVILPYRLYERDIRHARVEAHRISSAVQAALAHVVSTGEDATDLVNRLQSIDDLDIHLRRLEPDEQHPALDSSRGRSQLDGTELTHTSAPIIDPQQNRWLVEMRFDLSPMKRESVRLILDLVVAVVLGAATFSVVVFLLVRHSLVVPLRRLTEAVERIHPGGDAEDTTMPEFGTLEMTELVAAVDRACRAHHPTH